MNKLMLTINWSFGIFFGVMALLIMQVTLLPAIPLMLLSLILLPPIEALIPSKTALSNKGKIFSTIMLLLVFLILVITDQDSKELVTAHQSGFSSLYEYRQARLQGYDTFIDYQNHLQDKSNNK